MLSRTLIPIIENRLYYIADQQSPKDINRAFFFNIDEDLVYDSFYQDFGPLSLSKIWKYISEVSKIMNDPQYQDNIFYHYCSPSYQKCTNAALLICAYQIVVLEKTSEEAYSPFNKVKFRPYRDATYGECSYKCSIMDCLKGLEYAIKLKWFDNKKFDIREYEHYEQIENGDLNWIIPGKFIAFSSPYDINKDQHGNKLFTPKDYLPIFKKLGVKLIIRLNSSTYDANQFINHGIQHLDMYFTDGTSPPKQIVSTFLKEAEKTEGVIAIHCKAGLGRTGTLIACYAIKHYQFNASDFIGWIRLCRPGSILGPQQYFLLENQGWLKKMGQNSPIWAGVKDWLQEKEIQKQMKVMNIKAIKMNEQEKKINAKGDIGQGKRLIETKMKKKEELKKK